MLMELPAIGTHSEARIFQVMSEMNQAKSTKDTDYVPRFTWGLGQFQRYVTSNPGKIDFSMLTPWCERQWLKMLQDNPDNVMALAASASFLSHWYAEV